MSIEKMRSSLNSDDLEKFDKVLSKIKLADNVNHDIIDFDDCNNFVIKSKYNTNPSIGIIFFRDGEITKTICN